MIFRNVKYNHSLRFIARLTRFLLATFLLTTTIGTALARQVQDDSPRELSGMSASTSFETKDDQPLDLQTETAISMLYRLRKASPATLDQFASYSRGVSLSQARQETIDYRFWLFRSSAKLKKIERVAIVDAPNTSDSIQHFYRCTAAATDGTGEPLHCTIMTRVVPSQLPLETEIDEPIEFTGLLYNRASIGSPTESAKATTPDDQGKPTTPTPEEKLLLDKTARVRASGDLEFKIDLPTDATETLVFIADRLAWYPDTEVVADKRMVALAENGFDVSQLDQIKRRNGKPLGGGDSEAFYQMLATVATQTDEQHNNSPILPIKTIIAKSADNIGARVTMNARCRDCTRVEVVDPEQRERYGIDHYYQLVLFPELDQSITLTENTDNGPVKAVYERFPITVCAIKLPAGVYFEDVEGEAIAIDGTFFRVWKYDSEINQQAETSGTISPLIISKDFQIIKTPQWLTLLFSWGLGAIAVGLAFMYAYHRVFKNRQPRPTESILDNLPDQLDVTGLD